MITYILTSTILSFIGWLAYLLLVRRKASPIHKKWFIYFVVISSLILPALGSYAPLSLGLQTSTATSGIAENYEAQLRHFCNCDQPNLSHRIHYRSNTAFNVLLGKKHWLSGLVLIALGLVLLRISGQYFYLFRLLKHSRKEVLTLKGKTFHILHTPKAHGVGAFQLGKSYLIWQKEMDDLTNLELDAILNHELSHLRQYNTLEKAILSLIQCVWLVNPAFYFFRKELELISEWIADEEGYKAIGSRKAYANLLLKLTERQVLPQAHHFKGQGSLSRRIHHLLNDHKSHWAIPLLSLLLVLCLQFASQPYLSAQIDHTLYSLETYEEIYQEHPQEEELLYCPDCHSVCTPEIEFNECFIPEVLDTGLGN